MTESESSTARLSASVVEISGFGAPSRITTPIPTRPSAARAVPSIVPDFASSSRAACGAITTSGVAPAATRRRISGVVANVILTLAPVRLRKMSAAASNAGSTAAPLSPLTSTAAAGEVALARAGDVGDDLCLVIISLTQTPSDSSTGVRAIGRVEQQLPAQFRSEPQAEYMATRPQRLDAGVGPLPRPALADIAAEVFARCRLGSSADRQFRDVVDLAENAGANYRTRRSLRCRGLVERLYFYEPVVVVAADPERHRSRRIVDEHRAHV